MFSHKTKGLLSPHVRTQSSRLTISFSGGGLNGFYSKIMPDLKSAFMPTKVDKSIIMKNMMEVLRVVAQELKHSTESKMDLPGRMINARHMLLHLSLDELRALEQQIKSDDPVVRWVILSKANLSEC